MATNQERFFRSSYEVFSTTIIDVSVFGNVYKEVRVYGQLVARVPENRFTEWLDSESTWKADDESTVTFWEECE